MKSFLMDITHEGAPQFVDPKDRTRYRRVLSKLRDTGHRKVVLKLEAFEPTITSVKQVNLFNVVIALIMDASGQDRETVKQTLLANFDKPVSEMTNQEFDKCLNHAFSVTKEMFDVILYINESGNIEQKTD